MPSQVVLSLYSDDDDDDDNDYGEQQEDTIDYKIHLTKQLGRRARFTQYTTGLTTLCKWLDNWTVTMAMREFMQNTIDYTSKMTYPRMVVFERKESVPEKVQNVIPSDVLKLVKSAINESTVQYFETTLQFGGIPRSSVITGQAKEGQDSLGFFIIVQADTTLFKEHLYQKSSKCDDISQSGAHGMGFKESALYLLKHQAQLRMWMPAAAVEESKPGDKWNFFLRKDTVMVVQSTPVAFEARNLVIAATHIKSDCRFNPCMFLAFHHGQLDAMQVDVRVGQGVSYYKVLLDPMYAGKFFNYGIEVNSYPILRTLGIGIDGGFKLDDRFRNEVHDVRNRVGIILKSLFRKKDPKIILDRIADKLGGVDLKHCRRNEDAYPGEDVFMCLKEAVHKWKNVPKKRVHLIDVGWSDAEKDAMVGLGYFLLSSP